MNATLSWTIAALAFFAGCAGDLTLDEVDPEAAPAEPTWTEHIEPLMVRYCTACHDPDEQGGEAGGIGLETCAKTRREQHEIRDVVFDAETMPPGGADRMPEAAQLALWRWYDQGANCD